MSKQINMSRLSPVISTALLFSLIGCGQAAVAQSQPESDQESPANNSSPNNLEFSPSPSTGDTPNNLESAPSQSPNNLPSQSPQQENGGSPNNFDFSPSPSEQSQPNNGSSDGSSQEQQVLIVEVDVEGVEGRLEDVVYNAADVQPGRLTTRSKLQEDVNAIFATGFFSNVRVVPEDTPLGVRVTFVVEANPVLDEVQVKTVPEDAEKRVLPESVVNNIFSEQYGETLNLKDLQANIEELNQWYQDNGYSLAQVVGSPDVSSDGVVTLTVAEGVIEDIQVRTFNEEGEQIEGKTRDFIVTREVQLSEGDVFKRDVARSDLERIFGLGIFQDASLSFTPGDDPRQVVLNFDVVEGNTGSIGAGAGVSSTSGVFGTVSFQERNLGGNNQDLTAEVQVGGRTLLFNTRFRDPWIAGDPNRTSYAVNLFRQRSISVIFEEGGEDVELPDDGGEPRIVRTGGGITFSRPLAPDPFTQADWRLSAGLDYQRVQVEDDDGDIAPFDEEGNQLAFDESGKDDLLTLEFDAVRDRRNNRRQPTDGSVLRLGVDQSIPVGSGSIFFSRIRGSYSYFIPVDFTNFTEEGGETLAFNVQGGTVLGDLPPYEAFSLGGTNSVRGYEIGALGAGRSFLQATAEYRFPIFSIIGGALFVDVGTDLGTADDVPGEPAVVRDKPGTGFGYGAGVRVQSPLGQIRLDFGVNDEGDNRIHFGIGERF